MFDMDNEKDIIAIIDKKEKVKDVIPVCLCIGNKYYSLLDINNIDYCSISSFKIVFGTKQSVFDKVSFNQSLLLNFNNVKKINKFIEDKQYCVSYIIFESSFVDEMDSGNKLYNEINEYCNMIYTYIINHAEKRRKERIKKMMEDSSNYLD